MNDGAEFESTSSIETTEGEEEEDKEEEWRVDSVLDDGGGGLVTNSARDRYGDIRIEKSSRVTIGSRTYIKGPVTIQQVFHSYPPNAPLGIQGISRASELPENKTEVDLDDDSEVPENLSKSETSETNKPARCANVSLKIGLLGGAFLLASISIIVIWAMQQHRPDTEFPTKAPPPASTGAGPPMLRRSEWGAENYTYARVKLDRPNYAIICHTAGDHCFSKGDCTLLVQKLQKHYHALYGEIPYNFLIGGDGYVYEGRGWDFAGAHTRGYDNRSLGFAFIGDFSHEQPTPSQSMVAKTLLEFALSSGKIDPGYKLLGQNQIIDTITDSPGRKVQLIIKHWPHWVQDP